MVIKSEERRAKEGTKKNYENNQKTINKMEINTYVAYMSMIMLNVNG